MSGAIFNRMEGLELPFIHIPKHFLLQPFRHAQNRIQRRAEFVAHVRQKFILEAGCPFEFGIGAA